MPLSPHVSYHFRLRLSELAFSSPESYSSILETARKLPMNTEKVDPRLELAAGVKLRHPLNPLKRFLH